MTITAIAIATLLAGLAVADGPASIPPSLEAGEWVHLKIVVKGTDATLRVDGATRPTLLVHDHKLGDVSGGVALFVGPGTDGYFKNLKITAAP